MGGTELHAERAVQCLLPCRTACSRVHWRIPVAITPASRQQAHTIPAMLLDVERP